MHLFIVHTSIYLKRTCSSVPVTNIYIYWSHNELLLKILFLWLLWNFIMFMDKASLVIWTGHPLQSSLHHWVQTTAPLLQKSPPACHPSNAKSQSVTDAMWSPCSMDEGEGQGTSPVLLLLSRENRNVCVCMIYSIPIMLAYTYIFQHVGKIQRKYLYKSMWCLWM